MARPCVLMCVCAYSVTYLASPCQQLHLTLRPRPAKKSSRHPRSQQKTQIRIVSRSSPGNREGRGEWDPMLAISGEVRHSREALPAPHVARRNGRRGISATGTVLGEHPPHTYTGRQADRRQVNTQAVKMKTHSGQQHTKNVDTLWTKWSVDIHRCKFVLGGTHTHKKEKRAPPSHTRDTRTFNPERNHVPNTQKPL